MAASRIASQQRLCRRHRYFFFLASCMVGLQFFIGYCIYSINVKDSEPDGGSSARHDGNPPDSIDEPATALSKHPGLLGRLATPRTGQRPGSSDLETVHSAQVPGKGDRQGERPRQLLRCDVTQKEALSAMGRATTEACKDAILDVACRSQQKVLYTKSLPRFCHLQGNSTGTYHGCHLDNTSDRDLNGHYREFSENTPKTCIDHCLRAGFVYAGLQYGKECWCGDSYGRHGTLPDRRCSTACPGNPMEWCGGYLAQRIFSTGLMPKVKHGAALVGASSVSHLRPVKIVFVLTLNGRQVRQVARLLHAIYQPQHFYYIHVDKRQEFMYRELLLLEQRLSNVRLAKTRFATIWGGVSLLQAHLHFMQELQSMQAWDWDYYINLSESDYPIKTVDSLTAFLTKYKGFNFLKSHGKDTPRFIQKQGLDQTFYECDNHLWRIGPRDLPTGIRVDGGSDWVGLHRKFVSYITDSTDDLVTGLKKMYHYTLLPAESFFHTVLQNSMFCDTLVDNNLHITNWHRRQGCKCQYKHIVDWCGCSPNDYKISDLDKLMSYEGKPIFFARKFEAIVNQEIINSLDVYLFNNLQQNMKGMTSYWQNEYHHLDKKTKVRDASLTLYDSFSRLTLATLWDQGPQCQFRPLKALEATVFYEADHFHGILVLHQVEQVSTGKVVSMETHMHPKRHYSIINPEGYIGRLQSLEVGTDFDPKELMFRNYGGLIGPYDEIILCHHWGPGEEFTVSIAWIDPANEIAASYDVKIPKNMHISPHNPVLKRPLRPGIWTVKLLVDLQPGAQLQFLVTPLTVLEGRPISAPEILKAHNGPGGLYAAKNFSNFHDALDVKRDSRLEEQAAINGRKMGKDLEKWLDSLVPFFWAGQKSCVIETNVDTCGELEQCHSTSWSSRAPDPKSDLHTIGLKVLLR